MTGCGDVYKICGTFSYASFSCAMKLGVSTAAAAAMVAAPCALTTRCSAVRDLRFNECPDACFSLPSMSCLRSGTPSELPRPHGSWRLNLAPPGLVALPV